ncbi:MAG: hypothetical protein ACJ74Z_09265 [Bryobacteraceae bacterium]
MSVNAVTALCNEALAPVKVHVAPGLLEKIAQLVLEGYAATPHGGLEIGGLLFGRRNTGSVTVEDFRPLPCDHSLGPRFILSGTDERSLRDLLATPATEPTLQGLCIVGWYCSHTRSDLLLLDRELILHDSYFAAVDDFIIIFKPRDLRNVTAGIFLRGAEGAMHAHCPATTLEVSELDVSRRRTRIATSGRCDLSAFSHSDPPSMNEHAVTLPYRSRAIVAAAADQHANERGTVLASATVKPYKQVRTSAKWNFVLPAAGALALLCVGAWQYLQGTQTHPANLSLNLRPHAGRLLLSWKSNLVKARRANVDIFDGTSSEHVNITDVFQPSGVLLFPHNAENVQAALTVETGNGVVVRHAFFSAPVVIKMPSISEKNSQTAPATALSPLKPGGVNPAGRNPADQQLASKITGSKHPSLRHSRRTRHKKTSSTSAPLQAR